MRTISFSTAHDVFLSGQISNDTFRRSIFMTSSDNSWLGQHTSNQTCIFIVCLTASVKYGLSWFPYHRLPDYYTKITRQLKRPTDVFLFAASKIVGPINKSPAQT
ncbi:hypothetical protein JM49_10740 [Pseudomonas chlororaphis subsp. aurantiaca]|nr:hypothetical protein JM49_10740 [Pseudomonas chlororaphis subsp. aurantiaca]